MGDFVMFFCCRVEFVIDRNMFYSTTNTSIRNWKFEWPFRAPAASRLDRSMCASLVFCNSQHCIRFNSPNFVVVQYNSKRKWRLGQLPNNEIMTTSSNLF